MILSFLLKTCLSALVFKMESIEPYAILRVEKVKSYAALAAMANHWFRVNHTPNADARRSHLNKVIVGDKDVVGNVKCRLKAKKISKLRKNGVLALELVMTFSPEFIYQNDKKKYRKDANERLKVWIKNSLNWARSEFGENLISAVIHLDESTPHLHLCVLPLKIQKNGRYGLCARDITGGKSKLKAMQDSYHSSVKSLGLQRGQKKARCQHQTIQDYHNGVQLALYQIKNAGLTDIQTVGKVNPFVDSLKILKKAYDADAALSRKKSTSIIKSLLKVIQELTNRLKAHRRNNGIPSKM